MRRRNQKIGIVSYSSRKEEETLINKKRSSSNHKWEGRASAKKGARRSFILPPQPASRLEKRNDKAKPELERSGQTRIGFTAWGLRESEKRNQAIGNSRESNVRESSETADSEYPSLVFTQIITRSQNFIARIGACFLDSRGKSAVMSVSAATLRDANLPKYNSFLSGSFRGGLAVMSVGAAN